MKELSLNILDIAQNSIRAEATRIEILIDETETTLRLTILHGWLLLSCKWDRKLCLYPLYDKGRRFSTIIFSG